MSLNLQKRERNSKTSLGVRCQRGTGVNVNIKNGRGDFLSEREGGWKGGRERE